MKWITSPFTPQRKKELIAFLREGDLVLDEGIEKMVCLLDESDRILACGGLDHGVIKDLMVAPAHQQEGLSATLISILIQLAQEAGITHLTLFTKPQNRARLEALGFSVIEQNETVLFMENRPQGIRRFLAQLPKFEGVCGCIVMNANPMTLGHLQLVRWAAKQCDHLYLFVVEEDRSEWPFQTRIELVRQSTCSLHQISVHSTGPYLISSATFPDYFLKAQAPKQTIQAELDLAVFLHHFVPALNLTRRFVGSEPLDPTTAAYNALMKKGFQGTPVTLIECPRFCLDQTILSASEVRRRIAQQQYEAAARLTPEPVSQMILAMKEGSHHA